MVCVNVGTIWNCSLKSHFSQWFVCLDLSFWLGLDLIVAGVGYVVVDPLGLCV